MGKIRMKKTTLILFAIFNLNYLLTAKSDISLKDFIDIKSNKTVEIVSDEVIIKFNKGVPENKISEINNELNVRVIKEIKQMGTYKVKILSGDKVEDVMGKYKGKSEVLYTEPNYILKKCSSILPNDSDIDKQWAIKKIELDKAWELETGKPEIVVAVIDSGVDFSHQDLLENIIPGYDFVNEDNEASDDNGHGTLVSGIISAKGNNSLGIAGVSWTSKILPIKVINNQGYGTYFDTCLGIQYAVDNGAKIINMSIGGYAYSDILKEEIDYAVNSGCIIMAGVGDDNMDIPIYPAGFDNVIGVAATNSEDKISDLTNYGKFVTVCSPGLDIYATAINGNYIYSSGSSMATAYVSGLAALVSSTDQSLSGEKIKKIINSTLDYIPKEGIKADYIPGRINVYRAVTLSKNLPITDIAIMDMKLIPKPPVPGQDNKVIVIIQNQGTIKTEVTKMNLYYADEVIDTITVPVLQPGEIITRQQNWRME